MSRLAWAWYGYAIGCFAASIASHNGALLAFGGLGLVIWTLVLWESKK